SILNGLVQSPERIQHKAVQFTKTSTEFHSSATASFAVPQRDQNTHHHIGCQCKQSCQYMIAPYKEYNDQRRQNYNGNCIHGVGIYDHPQLNSRGKNRNQISLVSPRQLCRAELSHSSEHLMADDRQKLKSNKMVAVLLCIMEKPSKHRQNSHEQEEI